MVTYPDELSWEGLWLLDKDEGDADFLITDKSTDKPDEQLKKKKKSWYLSYNLF